jgi:hypothetical protein
MDNPLVTPGKQGRGGTQFVRFKCPVIKPVRRVAALQAITIVNNPLRLTHPITVETKLRFQDTQQTKWANGRIAKSVCWMPATLAIEVEPKTDFHGYFPVILFLY